MVHSRCIPEIKGFLEGLGRWFGVQVWGELLRASEKADNKEQVPPKRPIKTNTCYMQSKTTATDRLSS